MAFVVWKLDSLVALLPLLTEEIVGATELLSSGRGGPGEDGGAGVREPRRPLQPAGTGSVSLDPSL